MCSDAKCTDIVTTFDEIDAAHKNMNSSCTVEIIISFSSIKLKRWNESGLLTFMLSMCLMKLCRGELLARLPMFNVWAMAGTSKGSKNFFE
jgi:hypothetical protein